MQHEWRSKMKMTSSKGMQIKLLDDDLTVQLGFKIPKAQDTFSLCLKNYTNLYSLLSKRDVMDEKIGGDPLQGKLDLNSNKFKNHQRDFEKILDDVESEVKRLINERKVHHDVKPSNIHIEKSRETIKARLLDTQYTTHEFRWCRDPHWTTEFTCPGKVNPRCLDMYA